VGGISDDDNRCAKNKKQKTKTNTEQQKPITNNKQ
jgi:hypothetical protein